MTCMQFTGRVVNVFETNLTTYFFLHLSPRVSTKNKINGAWEKSHTVVGFWQLANVVFVACTITLAASD